MKRFFALICLVAALLGFTASAAAEGFLPGDFDPAGEYTIQLSRVLRIAPVSERPLNRYSVQQGAATDGVHAYFILENQADSLCAIWKVRLSDWTVVKTRFDLPLDHGNSLCYNDKTGRLIVVHNKPNYHQLSFIDPETLDIVETRALQQAMYGIAYDKTADRYVVGLSGSYDFVVLDSDFKLISAHRGIDTGLVKQGLDCDSRYIYFPQNASDNTLNQIVVYNWEGAHISTIRVSSFQEIEEIFHVDDSLYLAFNAGGSYVYKGKLVKK